MGDEQEKKETVEEYNIDESSSQAEEQKTLDLTEEKRQETEEKPQEEEKTEETKQETEEAKKEETRVEEPKEEKKQEKEEKPTEVKIEKIPRKPIIPTIVNFYNNKYKKLLILPLALLILSILLIGIQFAATGDFIKRDVSLKGGLTITIPTEKDIDINSLESSLSNKFPDSDISVRSQKSAGKQVGIIIDASDINSTEIIDSLQNTIGKLEKDDYSVEFMGSSLGASFFKETLKAIYISFLFMGIVVFWYFGTNNGVKLLGTILTLIAALLMFVGSPSIVKDISAYILGILIIIIYLNNSIPSFMVVFNVFADLIVTLSIVNLLGIKLSTAGIAAFLMIIGYSVDTNILLSTKLIKRKEGSINERLANAIKTGITMTITTLAAVLVALIFTQSGVIKQIMLILLVGLIVDTIFTWIFNVGILRLYLESNYEGKETKLNKIIKQLFKKLSKKNELQD